MVKRNGPLSPFGHKPKNQYFPGLGPGEEDEMACGGFMYTVEERRFPVGDPLPSIEFANHVAQMIGKICEASGSLSPRFKIEKNTFVATGEKSRAILKRVLPQAVSMTAHALLAIQEGRRIEFTEENNRLQMAVQL